MVYSVYCIAQYFRVSYSAYKFSVCHSDLVPAQCINFDIQSFDAVNRKSTFGFIQRLAKGTNSLIMDVQSLWIVRIDI